MTPEPQPAASPERRWYQFSLRTLLIGTAVGLMVVEWGWMGPIRRQRDAVQMVQRLGGHAFHLPVDDGNALLRMLREWLPDDLAPVNYVSLELSAVSDDDLRHLSGLPKLRYFSLYGTQVTNKGLMHLSGLRELREFSLSQTLIADDGLACLSGCTQLHVLSLAETQLTDDGLVHLAGLQQLSLLYLSGTQVTDAGLVHLVGLDRLSEIWLDGTPVTDDGIRMLRAAVPGCLVHSHGCFPVRH